VVYQPACLGKEKHTKDVKWMLAEYSIQSFFQGAAAFIMIAAVALVCTKGKSALLRHLKKDRTKERQHEKS
jgi:hypothetical protein